MGTKQPEQAPVQPDEAHDYDVDVDPDAAPDYDAELVELDDENGADK